MYSHILTEYRTGDLMEDSKKTIITLAEAKELLSKIDLEKADQIQKRTLDYTMKFSKIDAQKAKELKEKLIKECSLSVEEAVELINIMPKTMEEIRSFSSGWKKILPSETVEKIIKILTEP